MSDWNLTTKLFRFFFPKLPEMFLKSQLRPFHTYERSAYISLSVCVCILQSWATWGGAVSKTSYVLVNACDLGRFECCSMLSSFIVTELTLFEILKIWIRKLSEQFRPRSNGGMDRLGADPTCPNHDSADPFPDSIIKAFKVCLSR